jgi:hypothetical protein
MQLPQGFIIDEPKKKQEVTQLPDGFIADELSPQKQGFISGVKSDIEKRAAQLSTIKQETDAGRQTAVERDIQGLGIIFGGAGDIAGRGMSAAARGIYSALPEDVQEDVSGAGRYIISTKPAKIGLETIAKGMQKYDQFAKENPRAARNIEAVSNIALSVAPVLKRTGTITDATVGVGKGIAGKFSKPEILNSEDLRDIGSQLFKQAEMQGAIMQPAATNRFFSQAQAVMPQTAAGRITAGDNAVTQLIDRWEKSGLKNEPLTFEALKEMDEELGRKAFENVDNFGKMTKEGKQFLDLQTKLRDSIESASPEDFVGGKDAFETAKEARKYWSAQMKLRDIERIIERGLNAEQPATAIKSGFNTLLNSKRFSQYNDAEKAAIRDAAKKGSLVNFLGAAGSRLNQVIVGSIGGATGGLPGAIAGSAAGYAVSSGARGLATSAQLKKANLVSDLIKRRVQKQGVEAKLTPELTKLLKEIGISQMPAGGVSELMLMLEEIQDSGQVSQ